MQRRDLLKTTLGAALPARPARRYGALIPVLLCALPASASVEVPGLGSPPPGHRAPLRAGALLSVEAAGGADAATGRADGFDLSDARLDLGGLLKGGFDWFVNAKLDASPAILDLELAWEATDAGFRVRAGVFRTPVSGELQVGAKKLDLLDRSQAVVGLSPGRQFGVELRQRIAGRALQVRAGVFNGNGPRPNDDDRLLYALRLDGTVSLGTPEEGSDAAEDGRWQLQYGTSGAWSRDADVDLASGLPADFRGERFIGGADLRLSRGALFVSAEGLYGSLDPADAARADVHGYQATVGFRLCRLVQLLARYDAFFGDGLARDRDLAIGSINLSLTERIALQGELRVPTRGRAATPGGVIDLSLTF